MDYGQHILHVQFSTMHAAGGYHETVLMKWEIDFVLSLVSRPLKLFVSCMHYQCVKLGSN